MTGPPLHAPRPGRRTAAAALILSLVLAGAVLVTVAAAGPGSALTPAVAGDFPWNQPPDLGTQPGQPPASKPGTQTRSYDLLGSSIRMIGALGVVLGLIWLVLWLARRFFTQRPLISGGHVINVLASRHIAPKKQIVVVDVEGQRLVLGVAGDSITFLTRLEPGEEFDADSAAGGDG